MSSKVGAISANSGPPGRRKDIYSGTRIEQSSVNTCGVQVTGLAQNPQDAGGRRLRFARRDRNAHRHKCERRDVIEHGRRHDADGGLALAEALRLERNHRQRDLGHGPIALCGVARGRVWGVCSVGRMLEVRNRKTQITSGCRSAFGPEREASDFSEQRCFLFEIWRNVRSASRPGLAGSGQTGLRPEHRLYRQSLRQKRQVSSNAKPWAPISGPSSEQTPLARTGRPCLTP